MANSRHKMPARFAKLNDQAHERIQELQNDDKRNDCVQWVLPLHVIESNLHPPKIREWLLSHAHYREMADLTNSLASKSTSLIVDKQGFCITVCSFIAFSITSSICKNVM